MQPTHQPLKFRVYILFNKNENDAFMILQTYPCSTSTVFIFFFNINIIYPECVKRQLTQCNNTNQNCLQTNLFFYFFFVIIIQYGIIYTPASLQHDVKWPPDDVIRRQGAC
jgi:hypothetical protein